MLMKALNFIPLIVCIFWSSNCSLIMIEHERERQSKMQQNHVGWTQEECEKYFGSPLAVAEHADRSKTCIYKFKRGYYGSLFDTKMWININAGTLGFGELFSVPMLIANGYYAKSQQPNTRAWITYDPDNRVKHEKCLLEIE